MIPELGWIRGVVTGWFWARAGLYGIGAITLALVAAPLGDVLPETVGEWIEEASIRDLLEVIASSMLLVATFSLGTMVAAYTAAAQIATPRATRVLIDDPVSQNVLSTFVGAFVFAIISLIALSLGLYNNTGRTILLFGTGLVVIAVIVTLVGWIDYLANLVRLGAVLNKVEAAAEEALTGRHGAPFLGARPAGPELAGGHAIRSDRMGYITDIDLKALDRIAADHGGRIRIAALPGARIGRDAPAAFADFAPSAEAAKALAEAFSVGAERTIYQDPRYGLIVLSEVASRSLSPGINDFGTAIGVIARLERLIATWIIDPPAAPAVQFPNVEAPGIRTNDLCHDAFGPLARDGAPILEVGIRLQKALANLAGLGDPELAAAVRRQSDRALAQALGALVLDEDKALLENLAQTVRTAAARSGAPAP